MFVDRQVGRQVRRKSLGRQVGRQESRQIGTCRQVRRKSLSRQVDSQTGRQVGKEEVGKKGVARQVRIGRQLERRVHLCQVYVARLQNENHPLHFIFPKLEEVKPNYHLRSGASSRLRPICKTKRNQDFITYKYQLLLVGNFLSSFAIYYLYSGTYYYTIASNSVIQPYMYNVLLQ